MNTQPQVLGMQLGEHEKSNLVIDEVHNLPSRGMDYFFPVLEVAFFERYLEALDRYPHPFQKKLTFSFHPKHHALKISCCDASSFLKEQYINFQQVIGFSPRLKPFEYYSQLIGLNTASYIRRNFLLPFHPITVNCLLFLRYPLNTAIENQMPPKSLKSLFDSLR